MTLTYVPPYFDILPMYFVILALLPAMMVLSRLHPALAIAASVLLWAVASFGWLELPRDPLIAEAWFFNPFCWQLVLFAGFAIERGWLPTPRAHPALIVAAVLLLACCVPLSWRPGLDANPLLQDIRNSLGASIGKSHEGPLRFAHFLALAYLANLAAGPQGLRLHGRFAELTRSVGRQSLACFMTGIALSFLSGVALMEVGRDNMLVVAAVNLTGIAVIVLTARVVAWFKSHPWRRAME
ncbi:MAG: OpgC domain-containing protein, partial [Gammaproteobacteria bacterium]